MPTNKTERGRLELAVLEAKNRIAAANIELELAIEAAQSTIPGVADLDVMTLNEAIRAVVVAERDHAVAEERLAVHVRGALS
jgi:hypothetical protein